MNRRDLFKLLSVSTFAVIGGGFLSRLAGAQTKDAKAAAKGSKISDKDILKEGQPASITQYCEKPEKQPNKFCPDYRKPGRCDTCNFFNKDGSLTDYKGGKYARCMLLTDPSKAQFVAAQAWCATYVQKSG